MTEQKKVGKDIPCPFLNKWKIEWKIMSFPEKVKPSVLFGKTPKKSKRNSSLFQKKGVFEIHQPTNIVNYLCPQRVGHKLGL